mgnify:CR=1 FL=1
MGTVLSLDKAKLNIECQKVLEDLHLGDSVSVNGACLTVVCLDHKGFHVELSPETVRRTNLGDLKNVQRVNLERALAVNSRIGGHIVQGHIDATCTIRSIHEEDDTLIFRFSVPKRFMRYIVEKGFIAIDGISLTVVKTFSSSFTVSVIPYTRANTTFKQLQVEDTVNLEVDILAKYVETLLASKALSPPS